MVTRAQFWAVAVIAGLAGGSALAWEPGDWSPAPGSQAAAPQGGQQAAADPGASVSIAARVVESAGAFERYVRTATAVNPAFDGANAVSAMVTTGAGYDPQQLQEGAVAYAALVALQEPQFVESLAHFTDDPATRAAYVDRLAGDPAQVMEFPGAREAAGKASASLAAMGSDLMDRGRAVKQAAYSVQRQPWAMQSVAEPAERLARVKAQADSPTRLSDSETQQMLARLVARRSEAGMSSASAQPTETVLRGLALAAAAMLGQADEGHADRLAPLMNVTEDADCLRRAKMDLHQCLAAAGPEYEDVFCAGEHALAQTGQCIAKAAGANAAGGGVLVPIARGARVASASVAVPVALQPQSYGQPYGTTDSGQPPIRPVAPTEELRPAQPEASPSAAEPSPPVTEPSSGPPDDAPSAAPSSPVTSSPYP